MLNLGVFLTILLGGLLMLFYTAEDLRGGTSAWANQLCDTVPAMCRHPEWPAFAAAALISVVVVTKLAGGR